MSEEPLFTIRDDDCRRDGLCSAVCPLGLLVSLEDGDVPVPLKDKEYRCIACGHCASVCPTRALDLTALPADGFTEVLAKLDVTPEQAEQFMRSRRSVRRYRDKPVPPELLARAVDAARWAPSGHNARPVRFSVIRSRAGVVRVAEVIAAWMEAQDEAETELATKLHLGGAARAYRGGRDLLTRGAPHMATAWTPERGVTPLEDGIIAGAHVDLAAHALGLGSCWCGYAMMAAAHSDAVRKALGVPEGHVARACLLLGWPKIRYRRIPPRPDPGIVWVD